MFRYVDVSTVDVETSKFISGHIKATGALFLEVIYSFLDLSHAIEKKFNYTLSVAGVLNVEIV